MKRGRALLAVFMVAVVALSVAAPAIAATSNDPVTDHLAMGAWDEEETAPNPVINGTVNVTSQDLSQGTTHAAIAGYEDDGGDWVAGADTPFVVNTTHDIDDGTNVNIYEFNPGHIEDGSRTAFPDKDDHTWTNASTWTINEGSSNVTISNTTVATGVEAVHFSSTSVSGVNKGEQVYEAKLDNWDGELDSDESKRVLQFAADVDTLQSDASIRVLIYDESGDFKNFTIDPDDTFSDSNPSVLGAGTNDYVKQVKLNDVSTTGGGSFDNIENVTVQVVADGGTTNLDTDFSLSWLDLRKKTKDTLGEARATTDDDGNDADGDGDWDEFQTIYNTTNTVHIYSMDTLDTEYDDAVVHDLEYPFRYEASGLTVSGDDGDYAIYWEENENPGYANVLNVTYNLELPSAIDLSYTSPSVEMTQKWNDQRYITLEQASEVSDSTNLTSASFSSVSTSAKGDLVTIQGSSVGAGERFLVHYELELTQEEVNAIDVEGEGGAAAPAQQGGGGLGDMVVGFFTSTLGIVLTAITGVVIWLRRRG